MQVRLQALGAALPDRRQRGNEIDEGAKRHDCHPLEAEPLEIVLDGFA